MVSLRCKMLVQSELKKLGLNYKSIELGQVEIEEDLTPPQLEELNEALKRSGIELIEDKKSLLMEKIKVLILELIQFSDEPLDIKLSEYLSKKLMHDYTYLSNMFSESQGITIEHFYIIHKVEFVKELLVYDELNISEIAWKLNYRSVSHLSNQFKKMTGLSPSFFKRIKKERRKINDQA